MTAVKSTHSFPNLNYAGIFDYIEDTAFMIKRNQTIYTRIVYFQNGYNKQCSRDGKLKMILQKQFLSLVKHKYRPYVWQETIFV